MDIDRRDDFYLRYYTGSHRGPHGHEFLTFEFRADGKLRYVNNSHYKREKQIRKEVFVGPTVLEELKKIVRDSKILSENDELWPEPSAAGKQEIEICMDGQHVSFCTATIGSLSETKDSEDPAGLRVLHFLVQDLRCFVFALVRIHFKINPIP